MSQPPEGSPAATEAVALVSRRRAWALVTREAADLFRFNGPIVSDVLRDYGPQLAAIIREDGAPAAALLEALAALLEPEAEVPPLD